MKVDVVLISGKQGAGKSTLSANFRKVVADQKLDWVVREDIFAGVIYEMHDACRAILWNYGVGPQDKKDGDLLQFLGTDWGRKKYGENIWVTILANKINLNIAEELKKPYPPSRLTIVVSDLRFQNEMKVWPDALKIRLECPSYLRRERASMWRENANHPSEVDLDDCLDSFDFVYDTSELDSMTIARKVFAELFYGP